MKKLILVSMILGCVSFSQANETKEGKEGKEAKGADAQAVNAACAADAGTANCGSMKVGTGLLKCLFAYKKGHKDYKFSEACHEAIKTMHKDHKNSETK